MPRSEWKETSQLRMASSGILRRVALVKNRRFGGIYRLNHQGDKTR
jgi:hypothetical protein